jgi:two-component system cell cycle sensor histidine kinase/response regulator CckA
MADRIEDETTEIESRYRIVADVASDAILGIDQDSLILYANPACEGVFGYGNQELVGRSLTVLMPQASRKLHLQALDRYLDSGEATRSWRNVELTGLHRGGRQVPLEVSFGVQRRPSGGCLFTGVVRDVSERRAAEEVERRAHLLERQLSQSQKMEALGLLASGVVHDMNNLLSAISGYVGLARATLPVEHEALEALAGIEDSLSYGSELTEGLRSFIEPSRETERGEVDLGGVLREAGRLLGRALPGSIRLKIAEPTSAIPVRGSASQLKQVILNLALNARDAMPHGGTLELSASLEAESALLVVRDSGVGMSAEVRQRLFEPFFTTRQGQPGSGLGLAIVQGIVKNRGGRVEVESELGVGSSFRVFLPPSKTP